jgi:hypothetical protein
MSRGQETRVTCAGGYVIPCTSPDSGPFALPAALKQAAFEQVRCGFHNRDQLGVITNWPENGICRQLATRNRLPSITAVLKKMSAGPLSRRLVTHHRHWTLDLRLRDVAGGRFSFGG